MKDSAEKKARNLLLWAPDRRYFEEEAGKWCASWGDAPVSFNGVDADPAALLDELRSVPMWSDVKAVRLTNAQAAGAQLLSALNGYLNSPSSRSALLVEYEGTLDYRAPAAWKELQGRMECRRCAPRSVEDVILNIAGRHNLSVTPEGVSAIREWSGGDLSMVASAMDLLTLYKAGEEEIEAGDVAKLLGAGGTPEVWDLLAALMKGRRKALGSLLHAIEEDGSTEPLSIVGLLAWQVRQLLLVLGCRAAGIGDAAMVSEKKYAEIKSRGQLSKARGYLSLWKEGDLRRALSIIYDLDLSLKGDPSEPWELLENAFYRLLPGSGKKQF